MKTSQLNQKGFTLIELVIAIVIMALMALGITNFISLGAKGYSDSNSRQAMESTGRFLVERLNREIRNAVPNSATIPDTNPSCLYFTPIVYAGRYSNIPTTTADKFGFALVDNTLTVEDLDGLNLVVNPSSVDDLDTTSSPQSLTLENVELVSDSGTIRVFTTDVESDFVSGSVIGSISQRLYLYNNDVTICINEVDGITRNGVQLEANIGSGGGFDIGDTNSVSDMQLARANKSIVHFAFTLLSPDAGADSETMTFEEDVKVLNAP